MKLFYDLWYRFGTPPWVGPARSELVRLVESGDLLPGRAIDLGCGEGDNAIFLAQHGFQVTAVDFSPAAIAKAKAKAHEAGADVDFVIDDLTRLTGVSGHFDVLVDYGTFDDLSNRDRAAYVVRSGRWRSRERSSCCGASSGSRRAGNVWQSRSCRRGTSRCDQARSSSGSRAPSTLRGSPARVILRNGHAAGRRTSSRADRHQLGVDLTADCRMPHHGESSANTGLSSTVQRSISGTKRRSVATSSGFGDCPRSTAIRSAALSRSGSEPSAW
jgi:hypothetical protein